MKQWVNNKLKGAPGEWISLGLIAVGIFLIATAFLGPPWFKLVALAWAVAP